MSILSLVLFSGCTEAQNIALNKSYTLSTLPNYVHSAPPSDKTSLTDGNYTIGRFWTTTSTVGWQSEQVTICIDLEKVQSIGAVTFNTVRNISSDINFPQNIFVFISNDNKHFRYVGDAADTPNNLPGDNKVTKFILNDINESARYISLTIIPQGVYIFCDEIEVLKGKTKKIINRDLIPKDALAQAVDSLKTFEYNRRDLMHTIANMQNVSKRTSGKDDQRFLMANIQLSKKNISENGLRIIKKRIGEEHASDLRRRFNVPFVVEKFNPWGNLSEFREPVGNADILNYHFFFFVPTNGVQYGAFVITNTNSSSQQFSFKITNLNTSINSIGLFKIPYVPSLNAPVPDPLVEVDKMITIEPGISEMFIFKITGKNEGAAKSTIAVRSANKEINMNIDAQVENLFIEETDRINANVWAYLSYPMLKDRQLEAAKDLETHHINTIVIPPGVIPKMGISDDGSKLVDYLANFNTVKNILLYMVYTDADSRNGYGNVQFMTAEWKNNFIKWYNNVVKIIDKAGFLNTQVYLYPYDEVTGDNVQDFKRLITWAKKTIPGIKFYATIDNELAKKNLLHLVDIAQIISANDVLKELPPHQCEIWMYGVSSSTRSLSPYRLYRLLAWDAFANDYKGIGFWNYADEGINKQLNLISSPLLYPSSSYSVIYNGPGKEIISSRRWEAFRLGIEEYSILKLYAKKFGIEKAKLLARAVISNPQDLNQADSIRNKMIVELSGK